MAPKEIVAAVEMQEEELFELRRNTSVLFGKEIHDEGNKIYIGTVDKGHMPIGFGQTIHSDGSVYVGYEYNYHGYGKRVFGTMTWSDGQRYSGQWHKNEMHGYGIYSLADEPPRMGIWENGVLKEWVTTEPHDVAGKKNLKQEEKKVFKESKVQ